ncbi:hypothetical protein GUJ93_ZPchr0002g25946 [Zizania palustris]|uniref:Transcription initiation factor TFIID subunit 9 n=1 Tax=Zizania palustris TaxID=103762 RepID=A0A8J5SP34_ZIZPA|nr:hypothetical protein GUJ93_ZPchr0002g25946 [Zizania palustris]
MPARPAASPAPPPRPPSYPAAVPACPSAYLAAADEPRDVRVVRGLLHSLGLHEKEYEPRVVHQFVDLAYCYVDDVLGDAQVYADHAGKAQLDVDDVRLAIHFGGFHFLLSIVALLPPSSSLPLLVPINESITSPLRIGKAARLDHQHAPALGAGENGGASREVPPEVAAVAAVGERRTLLSRGLRVATVVLSLVAFVGDNEGGDGGGRNGGGWQRWWRAMMTRI